MTLSETFVVLHITKLPLGVHLLSLDMAMWAPLPPWSTMISFVALCLFFVFIIYYFILLWGPNCTRLSTYFDMGNWGIRAPLWFDTSTYHTIFHNFQKIISHHGLFQDQPLLLNTPLNLTLCPYIRDYFPSFSNFFARITLQQWFIKFVCLYIVTRIQFGNVNRYSHHY